MVTVGEGAAAYPFADAGVVGVAPSDSFSLAGRGNEGRLSSWPGFSSDRRCFSQQISYNHDQGLTQRRVLSLKTESSGGVLRAETLCQTMIHVDVE